MYRLATAILALAVLSSSCAYIDHAQSLKPPAPPTPTPTPQEKFDKELQAELQRIAGQAMGQVGVGAHLIETGETVYIGSGGRFPMLSVYKLPIAMAVLKLVDEGKMTLDQQVQVTPGDFVRRGFHSPIRDRNRGGVILPVSELIRASVSESDGTASDVLLDLAGGPIEVQKYINSLGVRDMIVADSEKSISKDWTTQYRNNATPEAVIKLLRALHERRALSEASTAYLLDIMVNTKTGLDRLPGKLPEGTPVAHKTGTGGTLNGIASATNDAGIITLPDGRHILIVVFVKDSPVDPGTREKVIAESAKAVYDKFYLGQTETVE